MVRGWENESARVPLAVIGILFIFISTAVSINITKMDGEMASAAGNDVDTADTALRYAQADLARVINYAGMEALKQMGETPVIEMDNSSQYNPGGSEPDIAEFNRNWARGMINYTLNQFIQANYMYDRYQYSGYGVNVEPLKDWRDIEIDPIYMALDRKLETPLLTPEETYVTYWKVRVPMKVSLVDLKTGDVIDEQDIVVGNLITSRYPLLEGMTGEYETRLNGAHAVMTETTAFAMAYTWGRGYLQYYNTEPRNIVTNEHLALIVNGALLADQGFVFNSVDPASIIEYAMQTKTTISGSSDLDKAEFIANMELNNGSFEIDPQADAITSTGDVANATAALEEAMHFDYNATPITDFLNNVSLPGGSVVRNSISHIIPQIYTATMATGVDRDTTVMPGDHDGYETDHYAEDWGTPDSSVQIGTVNPESEVPGSLYGEIWEVTWTREHEWRHYYVEWFDCTKTRTVPCTDADGNPDTCTEEYLDMCSIVKHNDFITIDHRVDIVTITLDAKENSRTNIAMDYAGGSLSTKNDVVDAFSALDVEYGRDPNLEEAYTKYKEVFDANVRSFAENKDLSGDQEVTTYKVTAQAWLDDEAQQAVAEITRQIEDEIHLDPNINYQTYPNPADAMLAAAADLTQKIEARQQDYVDRDRYMSGGKYSSASAKAISQVREWYVDQVLYQVNEQYGGAADMINDKIDEEFGDSADDVRDANKDGADLLKEAISFPIGLTMMAQHVQDDGAKFGVDELAYWDEEVTLGVDMEPDYLNPLEPYPGESFYTLKLRNINWLGPTGVYVMPSLNPWVCTVNTWSIEVEGEIVEFTLQDGDNEVHPNPIFGHEAQIYSRINQRVLDPITDEPIRNNQKITFSFITGTFIGVPPGKFSGIGDKPTNDNPEPMLEETKGW